jgi:predicted DNA-binding antitoxin AbrB/MazE fold protein
MTTTVRAIYENGVLRPERALPLAEGQSVDVTVATAPLTGKEWEQRVRAAKTIDEWVELANSCPDEGDDDYDVVREMNQTRRAKGERLLTVEDPRPST